MTATEPAARRTPRTALWVAVSVAVVLALLVAVLATRDPASARLAKSPLLRKHVPALTGETVDGASYDIDDRQGEWVVVNFFATWCVACKEEHDDLVRFSEGRDDASVVSVVFNDTPSDVEGFFEERGGEWPVVRDEDASIAIAFGVGRVPESYIVAPNGIVVGKVTGGVTDEFLNEQIDRFEAEG